MSLSDVQSLQEKAIADLQAGRKQQAVETLLQLVKKFPRDARSRFILGFAAHRDNQLPAALNWLNQAIAIDPAPSEPYFLLGVIFQQQNQLPQAIDSYQRFLTRKPDDGKGLNNLGRALLDTGKIDEAIEMLHRAVAAAPTNAGAFSNLGEAFRKCGKMTEAMEQYQKAIAVDPQCAEAHGNMGVVLAKQGNLTASVAAIQRAIAINPRMPNPRFNLARVFKDGGRLDDALKHCRIALEMRPTSDGYTLLGFLLGIAGEVPQCIVAQLRAAELQPDFSGTAANLLLSYLYLPDMSPDDLFTAHLQWAARYVDHLGSSRDYRNNRDINRRLRIGYVSPNFNMHSVAYFIEQILQEHDRNAVEIFCYSHGKLIDSMTDRLRGLSDQWRDIEGKPDSEADAMIQSDAIDILVDLAGHTSDNRLPLFGLKPAPVQMCWLGYPATTGMKAIEYRLTDPIADPPGASDALHTEKLLRIPGGCWAYQAPPSPPVGPFPGIANGFVTFGSFNNLPKVTLKVIETWAAILTRVPGSRLLLKAVGLKSTIGRDYINSHFAKFGIAADRIELVGWAADTTAHLQLYNRVDIALDTFPYNGTTTTCEALWMGVPVVTFTGAAHVSRVGTALLTHANCTEWIAEDTAGYVETAIRLAGQLPAMAELRVGLRERVKNSSICDGPRLARELEKIYRQAWLKFVESEI